MDPSEFSEQEKDFMREAIAQARKAFELGEVPVGAVVVWKGDIVAKAHNLRETTGDPLGHAEIVALREAARLIGGWRLEGSEVYVTIEPCPMCSGALIQARVARLIYGARDQKAGCAGSVINLFQRGLFNHFVEVKVGLLAEECASLMREFFEARRGVREADGAALEKR